MECLSVSKLPEGHEWLWEVKLDGYRALGVKSGTGVTLFSRRRKSLNRQFPYIVEAPADLPEGTVVSGLGIKSGRTTRKPEAYRPLSSVAYKFGSLWGLRKSLKENRV